MRSKRDKIAFLHRYGLGGWICCGGHCIPRTFEILREHDIEIHYFGPHSTDVAPEGVEANIVHHQLPYTWNRSNPTHKWSRTILWYLYLPWLALYCRLRGMRCLIHIDDTLPFSSWLFRILFGRRFALTAMDFFVRIYTENYPKLKPLCDAIEWLDLQGWKRTPVLFTKVFHTQTYLAERGIPREQMFIARNPCNQAIYHPLSDEQRKATRANYSFSDTDIVLSHHGILHPNKGNDWIIRQIATLKDELPNLRFLLIGNGPEKENLEQLARDLGLSDRITFTDWLPTEAALNEAIAAADLGLVMRIGQETDHFHMTDTLTHEMACAKPILAVNLKGIAEVIEENENGLLFDPLNAEQFAEKLRLLYHTPDRWKTMGQKALATIEEISNLETCANQLAQPILELAKKQGK